MSVLRLQHQSRTTGLEGPEDRQTASKKEYALHAAFNALIYTLRCDAPPPPPLSFLLRVLPRGFRAAAISCCLVRILLICGRALGKPSLNLY